ncbi:MAG: fimbria/pilus periplasmic chaperone [Myxococcota bacterium]
MRPLIPLLASLLLPLAAPAHAGNFQASPVRVDLSEAARSVLVQLVNRGAEPVRLQVTTFTWGEGRDGTMQLAPSDDIVVFPSLLELAPGESRKIRVGMSAVPSDRERSYRMIVEELPAATVARGTVAIRMRLSLPVFAGPARARPQLSVDAPRLSGRSVALSLANNGQAHLKVGAISVSGERDGHAPVTTNLVGWYLLPGGRRDYRVELPPGPGCIQRIHVRVESDGAQPIDLSQPVGDGSCHR